MNQPMAFHYAWPLWCVEGASRCDAGGSAVARTASTLPGIIYCLFEQGTAANALATRLHDLTQGKPVHLLVWAAGIIFLAANVGLISSLLLCVKPRVSFMQCSLQQLPQQLEQQQTTAGGAAVLSNSCDAHREAKKEQ